ncbi:hypothetical protein LINGRAHAP2_LOCUS34775, partial [Linum grandiflorum]
HFPRLSIPKRIHLWPNRSHHILHCIRTNGRYTGGPARTCTGRPRRRTLLCFNLSLQLPPVQSFLSQYLFP